MLELDKKVGEKIGFEMRFQTLLLSQDATNGTISNRILGDRIMLEMIILVAERHNKLFDLIDSKMQQLFEGGIFHPFTEKIRRKTLDRKRFQKFKEPFAVLTFDELEAGFVVCFVPLIFALAAFCLEWLVVLKDFLLVKGIFETFFRVQRNLLNNQSEAQDLKIAMWKKIVNERQDQARAKIFQAMWRRTLKKQLGLFQAIGVPQQNLVDELNENLENLISEIMEA